VPRSSTSANWSAEAGSVSSTCTWARRSTTISSDSMLVERQRAHLGVLEARVAFDEAPVLER
jgi:hypothetical protein